MNYSISEITKPFMIGIPQFFGIGASNLVGAKLNALGCKKVLIICDKGVEGAGLTKRIADKITEAGIENITFNGVLPDPPDTMIAEVDAVVKANNVDGLVAVGGGSSIDTAKAASLLSTNEGPINRFFDLTTPRKPGIPLVVIPTTAGTGSEVSGGGVITETATQVKKVFITAPTMALIDPELTLGVPKGVTAACAFDVLAHCLDAIFSTETGAFCKLVGYDGVKLFKDALLTVYNDGSNIEARSAMAQASNIGGICISCGGINVNHALAHSLGARYHVAHGAACYMFMPACLEFEAEACPDEIRTLAGIFGVDYTDAESTKDIAAKVSAKITELGDQVNMPKLKDVVPSLEEALEIAKTAVLEVSSTHRSAVPVDEEACRKIIEASYNK